MFSKRTILKPLLVKRVDRFISSWFRKNQDLDVYENVTEGLKKVYKTKLLPIESAYFFHDFHSPELSDQDFDAKPLILLMGQYSTGKTSLIKYLLESDFPGGRIGPEPTTDRFITLMYGEREQVIPGNAVVVDPKRQFRPMTKFGNAFLNRFQCSLMSSHVLKSISIVDTPGILSGEKQRIDRGYDFSGVLEWFAERVDRIILLFDAHKLDISDEFRRSIETMRRHDDKIRIVLNKADMVDHQQLMRVYGALMWSLGKILNTPEVARVYIGSYWDKPLQFDVNRRLFEDEEQDLFADLKTLPRNAVLRKLSDISKRARLAKVHACIVGTLSSEMPSLFGKEAKKMKLIMELDAIFKDVQHKYKISSGDFPEIEKMKKLDTRETGVLGASLAMLGKGRNTNLVPKAKDMWRFCSKQRQLLKYDFSKFRPVKAHLLSVVDEMLANDIARLMAMIPHEEAETTSEPHVKGGAFAGVSDQSSPFGYKRGEGIDEGAGDLEWVVAKKQGKYNTIFQKLEPVDGKLTRSAAKKEMMMSKLPNPVLGKIYLMADVDEDGFLDADEFSLMMHLVSIKLAGHDLPQELPPHLVPPSKRQLVENSSPNS